MFQGFNVSELKNPERSRRAGFQSFNVSGFQCYRPMNSSVEFQVKKLQS